MSESRPAIPNELKRLVLVEAGHRCAIPTCEQTTLEVAHIEPWSKTKSHEFHNLIALCPNCHTRFDKGEIDRKAMLAYKANLNKGADSERQFLERVRRLEMDSPSSSSPEDRLTGFVRAVSMYQNRVCPIGIGDNGRFVMVGHCTFIRPRTAIVPGEVIDVIHDVLELRTGEPVVGEPGVLSKFEVRTSPGKWGDLRLIEVDPVPEDALDHLIEKFSEEHIKLMINRFKVNETPLSTDALLYTGEHVGMMTSPENSADLRGTGELQFQDAHVSFFGNIMHTEGCLRYLTPVPSGFTYKGAPVFNREGTLLGLITDTVRLDSEFGFRPVCTTLLSLGELWVDKMKTREA